VKSAKHSPLACSHRHSRVPQECISQGEPADQTPVKSEARVLRIVKVLRILKITRILKAFKVVE
jgi:hypothetical protein